MWFVANWSSIPSCEHIKGVAKIPALLLEEKRQTCHVISWHPKLSLRGSQKDQKYTQRKTKTYIHYTLIIFCLLAWMLEIAYIRMFSGRFRAPNCEVNFFTDAIELRSNSKTSTFAVGISLMIASLTLWPADKFLTPITTWTPRSARTRAVSVPMPLDAPVIKMKY